MWWEAVPSLATIYILMVGGVYAVPKFLLQNTNKGGQGFMKDLQHSQTISDYLRDERITGHAYIAQGLEAIADEEPPSK